MKQHRIIPSILLAASLAFAPGCAEKKQAFAWLSFFTGTVDVASPGGKTAPAQVKMELAKEDRVRTGAASTAFVQYGYDILLQMSENSECALAKLPEKPESAQSQSSVEVLKGGASFYADKLSKDGSFTVKLKTSVIAVRGTLFSAALEGDAAVVMVDEGEVEVTGGTAAATRVRAGEKATMKGDKTEITKIADADAKVFKDMKALRPLPGMTCIAPDYVEKYFRWRLGLAPAPVRKAPEKKDAVKKDDGAKSDEADENAPAVKARLGITGLVPGGVDAAYATGVTDKIYAALKGLRGANEVVYRAGGLDRKSVNRLMTGRINGIGQSRVIAVNVIDAENGAVLYSKTVTLREGDSLDAFAGTIAGEVNAVRGVWE